LICASIVREPSPAFVQAAQHRYLIVQGSRPIENLPVSVGAGAALWSGPDDAAAPTTEPRG